jgi:hypothetical protein
MAATVRRRGYGEDSIYFDAVNNCWSGAVSVGYSADGKRRIRRKVTGRTKTEVKDKLKALHRDLDAGIRPSPVYTMALCIEDWLSQGLTGRSADTVANYRYAADHAIAKLGAVKLEIGQWVSMSPTPSESTAWKVGSFAQNEWLLWRKPDSTWSWVLRDLGNGRTRLITRVHVLYDWSRRHTARSGWSSWSSGTLP